MPILPEIICFASGLILGALIYRLFTANTAEAESLSKALDEIQAEYANYQQNVDVHFKRSAELFNQLTDSYSEVHQHLSEGAQNLSHHPIGSEMVIKPNDETHTLPSALKSEADTEQVSYGIDQHPLPNPDTQLNPTEPTKKQTDSIKHQETTQTT